MKADEIGRRQAKTAEQRLLNILQGEFHQPPRIAAAMVAEAQACLQGQGGELKAGQVRVILVSRAAGHGRKLAQTPSQEVVWTVDAGAEDDEVGQAYGSRALRRQRVQRLLDEAIGQGAVASQEDLARVLNVSVRSIKRDCAALQAAGIYLPLRGNLHGIGRGQTHKALIVGRWLAGATYDQIARQTHHSLTSVQRYVQAFVRVIQLQQQGFAEETIALLLQLGQPLVRDYLAIYQQHDTPLARQRLSEQLQRLSQRVTAEKTRLA